MNELTERILVYGPGGAGKTYAWLKIAELFPQKTFHVLDTDEAVARTAQGLELKNLNLIRARDWAACGNGLTAITKSAKPGDWIVVDFLCSAWDFVQSYFVSEVFKEGIGEYFLGVRKELKQGAKSLGALRGWTDWVTINKLYQEWAHKLFYVMSSPPYSCNIYVAAKGTRLSREDEQETLEQFANYGYKPEGEKRNLFRVHTVLLLTSIRNDYFVTSVKDRSRSLWDRKKVTNFAIEYGVLAGWV